MKSRSTLLVASLVSIGLVSPGYVKGSEILLAKGKSGWRYLDTKEGPPAGWTEPDFDDSGWKSGTAPLGYGENDVRTEISYGGDANDKHIAAFFRLKVDVKNKETLVKILSRIRCDDGAVIYVNGREVHRHNMRPGKVGADTTAARALGPDESGEAKYYGFLFDAQPFKTGSNVIAISVHQGNATSSDLYLDIEMHGLNESEAEQAEKLFERARSNQRRDTESSEGP